MAYKKFHYRIIRDAKKDIDEIVCHISTVLCNSKAAVDFLYELDQKLDIVCENPKIGTIVENEFFTKGIVRRVNVKNYNVYYFY